MSMFRVTPSTLRDQAEQLRTLNGQFKTNVTSMSEKENALAGMWEGEARDAFHNAFTSDKAQFDNFHTGIEQFVTRLEEAASAYSTAESTNLNTALSRKA